MAFTITSGYIGEAGDLLKKAFANTTSLAQGGFTIKENVKGYYNLRLVDGSEDLVKDEDGLFKDAGTMKMSDKKVTLKASKVNKTVNKHELNTDWSAKDMAAGANGMLGGQTLQAIQDEFIRIVGLAMENAIWTDIIAEADADSDVIDVDLVAITSANVIAELSKLSQAYADKSNHLGENVKIYCHPAIKAMYNTAQGSQGVNDYRGDKAQNFEGYEFVTSIKIPKDKIIMTPMENMYFMTDLKSDLANVSALDQSAVTGANSINFAANFSYKATYVRGSELILGTVPSGSN